MVLPIKWPNVQSSLRELVALRPCSHTDSFGVDEERGGEEYRVVGHQIVGDREDWLPDSGHGAGAESIVFLGLLGGAVGSVGRRAQVCMCGLGVFIEVHCERLLAIRGHRVCAGCERDQYSRVSGSLCSARVGLMLSVEG